MIFASTLRILYYVISPYEPTLLHQSMVQLFIQSLLLHISLKYRPSNYDPDFLPTIPSLRLELKRTLETVNGVERSLGVVSGSWLEGDSRSGYSERNTELTGDRGEFTRSRSGSGVNGSLSRGEDSLNGNKKSSEVKNPAYHKFLNRNSNEISPEWNPELSRNLNYNRNYKSSRSSHSVLTTFRVIAITVIYQVLKFFDVYYKRPGKFWQWKDHRYYWAFILGFISTFSILTLFFQNNQSFGSFLGTLGLFIESLLPLPQILLLSRLKSVKNFKLILLFSWYGGDLTKLTYLIYYTDNISIIFILAGLFQMFLDIYIGFQYITLKYYQSSPEQVLAYTPIPLDLTSFTPDDQEDPFQIPYDPPHSALKELELA